MTRLFLATTILFAVACQGTGPSQCLENWSRNGFVDPDLVCADHLGDEGDEFILYAFAYDELTFTGPGSFLVSRSAADTVLLDVPGASAEFSSTPANPTYLCTEFSTDRLFLKGQTISPDIQVRWLEAPTEYMICAH